MPAVLVVDTRRGWPDALLTAIAREGFVPVRIADVRMVPFFVLAGGVAAVVVGVGELEALGLLALRQCREKAPETAVIVAALDASPHTVKLALDSGATAFLSWPATARAVARALRSV